MIKQPFFGKLCIISTAALKAASYVDSPFVSTKFESITVCEDQKFNGQLLI